MTNGEPSKKEKLDILGKRLDLIEAERPKGLKKLALLQNVKAEGEKHEKERMTRKYGVNHPRISKITDRQAYNTELKKELNVEIERASKARPTFDIYTWMVHGHVLNKEGAGRDGLTVSLYDEKGNWFKKLGYACTDESGYFELKYRAEPEKTSEIPESQKLILTITDSKYNVLHRETEPLYINPGRIDYRLIVLDDRGEKVRTGTPPQPERGDTTAPPTDAWSFSGKVVDENGQPVRGMIVSLYDKDLAFDDRLGAGLTDNDGHFKMTYRADDFRDMFQKNPNLYVKVLNSSGNTLFRTRKPIHAEAGRTVDFQIKIKMKPEKRKSK
jgi:hypothetical protein